MVTQNLSSYVGWKIGRIAGNDTEMEIILSNGSKHTFLGKEGCTFRCPDFDYAQGGLKQHGRIRSASLTNEAVLQDDGLLYKTILTIDVGTDTLIYCWEIKSREFMTSVVNYIVE